MIAAIAERVAATPFADWATSSALAYPVANVVHVLALVLLLGGIGLTDLRILGAFRSLPLQPLFRAMVPIAAMGVAILAASGSILFAADAVSVAGTGAFRLKLILIAIALANVLLFRVLYGAVVADPPPAGARLLAVGSLLLWTGVAIAGRMIAYS
jgi:hypothetical protein